MRPFWLAIPLCAAAPVSAADLTPVLDIKPGLWEISLAVKTTGPPRSSVKRRCLEPGELLQSLVPTFGSPAQHCTQTVTSASTTRQEIRVDCGQEAARGGGKIVIEARDPKNVKVTSEWSAASGARTLGMTSSATLRWLGPACDAPPEPSKPALNADYYYKLGKEQTARDELWEALRSLNRAVELDPQRALSYNARGYVYLRLRSYANANVEFTEAIRLRPGYANAYQNRAIARRHLYDAQGAAADEQKAAGLLHRH